MIIALTVWEDRISPVFDVAAMILLAEIKNGMVSSRQIVPFNPGMPSQFAEMLKQMKVSVLICGAISAMPENILSANGMELIPFISGKTEQILGAYAKNKPIIPAFLMPGFGRQRRRRGRNAVYTAQLQKEVESMPRYDGSGPMGNGPMTGGMRGYCNPAASGNRASFYGTPGFGRGMGLGRGFRGGMGQRAAGGWGRGFGYPPIYAGLTAEDSANDMDGLKAQSASLQNSLDAIGKRIAELEKRSE